MSLVKRWSFRCCLLALSLLAALGCKQEPLSCAALCDKAAQCAQQMGGGLRSSDLTAPPTPEELRERERNDCQKKCAGAGDQLAGKLRLCTKIDDCEKFNKCLYPGGKTTRGSDRPLPG